MSNEDKIALTNGVKTRWVKPGTKIAGYRPVEPESFTVETVEETVEPVEYNDFEMPDEEE